MAKSKLAKIWNIIINKPKVKGFSISDPYVVQFENTTDEEKQCALFGVNAFWRHPNLGSDEGVVVKNLQGGNYSSGGGYDSLFMQSAMNPFKIGKWRFQSRNADMLERVITLQHYDGNGKIYSSPLNLSIMRDAYQMQNDILDVAKSFIVDGRSVALFTLPPKTILVISMFPTIIYSIKAWLNGGMVKWKAPRLSGKNASTIVMVSERKYKRSERWNKFKLNISNSFSKVKNIFKKNK